MARIVIHLKDHEEKALVDLAQREFRDPRSQAALIVLNELKRRGLITTDQPKIESTQNANQNTA